MNLSRNKARKVKQKRLRAKSELSKAVSKPRLSVFKSHANFYAQLIDDQKRVTLASVSSLKSGKYGGNVAAAKELGLLMGQKILDLKLETVAFDRNGYLYHGRVKAFADAVREKGVKF